MLELDINKVKNLDFEVQLSGIDHAQLEGWLRILIDGTEYGFKADVTPTNVIVNVPELKDMMLREFKEGEEFNGKLELHGGGFYFNPWNGVFVVKNPVLVEVKIKEDIESPKVKAKAKAKLSIKEESRAREIKKVISEPLEKKKVVGKKPLLTESKKSELSRIITEKHILAYMKSKGTTNPEVQKLILGQCKNEAKSNEPLDVLRSVVHFYKNKNQYYNKSKKV